MKDLRCEHGPSCRTGSAESLGEEGLRSPLLPCPVCSTAELDLQLADSRTTGRREPGELHAGERAPEPRLVPRNFSEWFVAGSDSAEGSSAHPGPSAQPLLDETYGTVVELIIERGGSSTWFASPCDRRFSLVQWRACSRCGLRAIPSFVDRAVCADCRDAIRREASSCPRCDRRFHVRHVERRDVEFDYCVNCKVRFHVIHFLREIA